MMKKLVLPLTGLLLCLCVLLVACGKVLSQGLDDARATRAGQLTPAGSYEDVLSRLLSARSGRGPSSALRNDLAFDGAAVPEASLTEAPMAENAQYSAAADSAPMADYSTASQVAGVDEADIVKTDGQYIYAASGSQLRIYEAAGADSRLLGRVELSGKDSDGSRGISELYLSGSTLAVLCSDYRWDEETGGSARTSVQLLDVSDPEKVRFGEWLGQDGNYHDSRLMGGVLYLISDYFIWDYAEGDAPERYIPALYTNEASGLPEPDCILLPETLPEGASYTVVSAIDVAAGRRLDSYTVLDSVSTVYMSKTSLYLCADRYAETESAPRSENQYTVVDYSSGAATGITAFALEGGLALRASGELPGRLLNQFSLDEKDGYLRLAVTETTDQWSVYTDPVYDFVNYRWGEGQQSSSLYILDGGLNIVGSLTGLGQGEQIYSVRFDGDLCYFVTFRQTDPLFAADLSDPARPVILSALKLPGFSSYLHVYGDGLLFGLGQWADEETGFAQALKLAMYDSSDPAELRELDMLLLEDCWYSPALYDHKALLILPEQNRIGFATDTEYLVFAYQDGAFVQLAALPLPEAFYDTYHLRGLLIRGDLYLVSSWGLQVYDGGVFRLLQELAD